MHQIFVQQSQIRDNSLIITNGDYHHLVNVLRIKRNEKISVVVNRGDRYIGVVEDIKKGKLYVKLIEKIVESYENKFKIFIAQSIPKGKKFEEIVKYGTELGINGFYPIISERVIDRLNLKKIERMRKIAKEEAQLSKRDIVPEIFDPIELKNFLYESKHFDKKFIFWELEEENFLENISINENESVVALIGNEGGFSIEEVNLAKSYGFQSISLGKRILRSELAPLVITTLFVYLGGGFKR